MTKSEWLDSAEIFDSWRVVPRLIVMIYLALLIWVTVYFSVRFFGIPSAERTGSLTAFATLVMTTAYGAFPFVIKIYVDSGRSWTPLPAPAPVMQLTLLPVSQMPQMHVVAPPPAPPHVATA